MFRICDYDPIARSSGGLEEKEGKLLRPPIPWRIAAWKRKRQRDRIQQTKQADAVQV
jgi:hypothetical protein